MALHYANGGPGPATRLLRVNADAADGFDTWIAASSHKWTAAGGWEPYPAAQPDIMYLGEYFPIGTDEVERVQQEIRDR